MNEALGSDKDVKVEEEFSECMLRIKGNMERIYVSEYLNSSFKFDEGSGKNRRS